MRPRGRFCKCESEPRTNGTRHPPSPFVTVRHPVPAYISHMDLRTAHALMRFGMGPSGDEPPPDDPSAWLLNQLHGPDSPWPGAPPSTQQGIEALRADRAEKVT